MKLTTRLVGSSFVEITLEDGPVTLTDTIWTVGEAITLVSELEDVVYILNKYIENKQK